MASFADPKPRKRSASYTCNRCGRRLYYLAGRPRWIHSTHTGARYCWPGEGCAK